MNLLMDKRICYRTIAYRNFDYFRTSATDLYATIHRLMGKGIEYADPRDKIAHGRINLKKQDLLRYLQHIVQVNQMQVLNKECY